MNVVVLLVVLGFFCLAVVAVAGFLGTPRREPRSDRPKPPWLGEGWNRRQVLLDLLVLYPLRSVLMASLVALALAALISDCV